MSKAFEEMSDEEKEIEVRRLCAELERRWGQESSLDAFLWRLQRRIFRRSLFTIVVEVPAKFLVTLAMALYYPIKFVLVVEKAFSGIDRPPGWRFLRFTRLVFSKKVADRVFGQIVNDISDEYTEALIEKRFLLARWIKIRGSISLVHALVLQIGVSSIKRVVELWKIVS